MRWSRNRARAHAGVDAILATAQRQHEAAEIGQNDMFGGPLERETIPLPAAEPWLPAERLQREFDAIGFFLSGHPLDDYAAALKRLNVQSWAAFANSVKQGATAGRVAGTVVARAERRTKTGNRMGILEFSDPVRPLRGGDLPGRPHAIPRPARAGLGGAALVTAEAQGDDVRARIQTVEPLDQAAEKCKKGCADLSRDAESSRQRRKAPRRTRGTRKSPLY